MKSLVVFFAAVLALSSAASCNDPDVGCCPEIVTSPPNPPEVSSVIQPAPGFVGSAQIIVDYGPAYPWGKRCNGNEGFIYYINWGDGSPNTVKNQAFLAPFHEVHTYPSKDSTYEVTVTYCSDPDPNNPLKRCCNAMTRTIAVSYNPRRG